MSSLIRNSLAAAFAALAAGAALPQAQATAAAEQNMVAEGTQGTAATPQPVTETLRGIVDSVDQGHDTLNVRLSPDTTEAFKVQDGLIFNSVRYGDPVELKVETIGGERTIVGLRKE
jgi:Cu/Ag efflux protein CusF